jgi:hypothetical protein
MTGDFAEGVKLIAAVEEKLDEYRQIIDRHRVMVLNYKFASLHFCNGNYSTAIDYLQKIINDTRNLRYDLQSHARILHLLAHLELDNYELVSNLAPSVVRFMKQHKDSTGVQDQIIRFLSWKGPLSRKELKKQFQKLLDSLVEMERNRFETRAFAFFDLTSWLEAKLENKTMSQLIKSKNRLLDPEAVTQPHVTSNSQATLQ